jgi:hypothetical protein
MMALARKYLNEVSRAFGDNNDTFLLGAAWLILFKQKEE